MLKNDVNLFSDGINVYITLTVKSKLAGKIILSTLTMLLCIAYALMLFYIPGEEVGAFIIPVLGIPLVIIFIPLRYLLWNLYGQQRIIVNAKTISYNHSYGWVETRLKTIAFNRLGTSINTMPHREDGENGTFIFYNYVSDTNLPEVILETSVSIPKEKLKEMDEMIAEVFYQEFMNKNRFVGFSLN